mmetsp:Transcript_6267/g.9957  ORF Transcript_6267/g.9957 Transcript_6267/m.9957 type:complete len:657 (-) Transcript_6267:392-2362(-)
MKNLLRVPLAPAAALLVAFLACLSSAEFTFGSVPHLNSFKLDLDETTSVPYFQFSPSSDLKFFKIALTFEKDGKEEIKTSNTRLDSLANGVEIVLPAEKLSKNGQSTVLSKIEIELRLEGSKGSDTWVAEGLSSSVWFNPDIVSEPRNPDVSLGRPTDSSVAMSVYFPCAVVDNEDCVTHDVYTLYRTAGSGDVFKSGGAFQVTEGSTPVSQSLTLLNPSAQYEYLLCYGTQDDALDPGLEHHCDVTNSFSTAKKRGKSFTFTIESDSEVRGGSDSPEMITQTMAGAASWTPDFHFHVGDFNQNDQWGNRFATLEERIDIQLWKRSLYAPYLASIPIFLVRGNHEGEHGYNMYNESASVIAEGRDMPTTSTLARKAVFDQPEPDNFYTGNDEDYPFFGKKNNWYAFEWGDALFIALDILGHTTECDFPSTFKGEKKHNCQPSGWQYTLGSAQYTWLAETLEASDANHKFVFIHHFTMPRGGADDIPFFEWGGHTRDKDAPGEVGAWEFDIMRPGWAKPVHELLVENDVDVVFHGHDHVWSFEPQEEEGIVYQEVPKPNQYAWNDSLANCDEGAYSNCLPSSGYVKVDVSEESFRVEYIREAMDPETLERIVEKSGDLMCGYTVTERAGNTHLVDADASCITSKHTTWDDAASDEYY